MLKVNHTLIKIAFACLAVLLMNRTDGFGASDLNGVKDSYELSVPHDEFDLSADNFTFSVPETECRVPRQTNSFNSTRTFSQSQRNSNTSSCRTGFTLSKPGKFMNPYTTSLFFISIFKFPSGLSEATHHLISLGKLII